MSDARTFGERAADSLARNVGSWRFVIIQTVLVVLWITFNSLVITNTIHVDPYPYILLNLGFSTQAAFAAPVLQMSNNRAAAIADARESTLLATMLATMKATQTMVEAIKADLDEEDEQPKE